MRALSLETRWTSDDRTWKHSSMSGRPQQSASSSSSETQEGSAAHTTATASAYLEALARSMVEAVNSRQLERHASSRFLSPNLQSYPDYSAPTNTIQDYFDAVRQLIATYPQYQTHLTDVKAHVNLRAGYADVYTKTAVTGLPPGVVRNSVCVFEFRWRNGAWICVKMTGIRGMNHDQRTGTDVGEGWS